MSELLLHWLNNDLQLSKHVTDIEADFASGYLLGEIMHRLNQQHNFADFMDSAIADAKIINFCLLEPTMRHVGIKFDSKVATAIMNTKRDAATNILHEIKMAAERLARAPPVSTKSVERANILPLHNMPSKLPKPAYDAANHYFFEHSVRRRVKSLRELKRERDAIDVEKRRMAAYREQQERIQEQLEITKAERLHQAFLHSEYIKTALDETDSPAWRLALQKKSERERRKAHFYQQLAAAKAKQQQERAFSLRQTVERDLDDFEQRGSSGSRVTNAASSKGSFKSAGYGLRSLSSALETQHAMHGSASAFKDPNKPVVLGQPNPDLKSNKTTIREQKHHRDRRRELFERRRKRFLQEALNQHSQLTHARVVGELEQAVQRHTNRETESNQEMTKILVYKEIATENRVRREESYANRREVDLNEAIDRDTESYELLFAKHNDEWEMLGLEKLAWTTARDAATRCENNLVARAVLAEIIDFTMVVAGKREDSMLSRTTLDFLPTRETWEELRFTFAEHGPLALRSGVEQGVEDLVQHQLEKYLKSFLPQPFLVRDYVGAVAKGTGQSPWVPTSWKFVGAVEILEDRFVLGEVVKYTRWLRHAQPPPPNLPDPEAQLVVEYSLPDSENHDDGVETVQQSPPNDGNISDMTVVAGQAVIESLAPVELCNPIEVPDLSVESPPRLCILLLGPPFSGRTTHAKCIAEKYDLALLSVEEQLKRSIDEQNTTGIEVHRLLTSGVEVSPTLYSQLVLDAIELLERRFRNRWILYDLPATSAHAQALEEHLTGFKEPSQIPSPFDFESFLAPGCARPPLPKSFLHGKSGVDLVFYLNCGEPVALERCLGQLEDGETKAQHYHLLYAPPPTDATNRHRLQHVNESTNPTQLLSLQWLATQDFSTEHMPWYRRFDSLREVETTESQPGQSVAVLTRALTKDAVLTRICDAIDAYFEQRQSGDQQKQREKEHDETTQMQEEEARQRKLNELKRGILLAQEDVNKAQLAVQHAEEAKAKKEEVAELKVAVEEAKKLVESALVSARDWLFEESLQVRNSRTLFSNRLLPDLGQVLASIWDSMEQDYSRVMRQCFVLLRQQREQVEKRATWVMDTMALFARRMDARQTVVNAFQREFNSVIEEMRFEDATKVELHARVDVLQDELCDLSVKKRQDSEQELRDIITDGWTDDMCQYISLLYQRILQAECDRFRVSVQLLVDTFVAASDEPAHLLGVVEQLKTSAANALLSELSLKTFTDVTEEPVAAPVAPAAAPTPAKTTAGAKGAKGKPPLVPTPSVHAGAGALDPAANVDPLSTEGLLAYDTVVLRSEALVQMIVSAPAKQDEAKAPEPAPAPTPVPSGKGGKTGNTPVVTPTATPVSSVALLPRASIDIATSNFLKAIRYEQELFARRTRFLKDSVQSACEHVARAVRSVEIAMQALIEQRARREDAAIAALVLHIRRAIEAEVDLPFYIDIQPEQAYRFPITHHLIEDTRVTVDSSVRLVAREPDDPPPEIEQVDPLLLNARQEQALQERLGRVSSDGDDPVLPLCDVATTLLSLTTVPHALPIVWRDSSYEMLLQVASRFADPASSLVRVHALVDAMMSDQSLLPQPPSTKMEMEIADP